MSKDDLEAFRNQAGVLPASYKIVGPDAASPGALDVIVGQTPEIAAFLYKVRQNRQLSDLPVVRASYASDDLDVTYTSIQGEERITFEPRVTPPIPEKPEPFRPPQIEPFDYPPQYDYPIVPTWTICFLVLYQNNKIAAFDMAQLDDISNGIAPIYTASMPGSSYTQPVITGQFQFAGMGFIQTDVDLSGNKKPKSLLSTTALFDATPIGAQWLPIMTSQYGPSDPPLKSGILVYTSGASFTLADGKLSLTTKNTNTQQCCAIDTNGTLYYGGGFNGGQVSLIMDKTDVDQTATQPALIAAQNAVAYFVTAYTVNYIRYIDDYSDTNLNCPPIIKTNHNAQGPYQVIFGTANYTYTATSTENIFEVATPVPSGDPATGPNANMTNITEIVGSSFYATATYTTMMMAQSINLSYDYVYYYTFSLQDNYYENLTASEPSNEGDFSGPFPRMLFDATAYKPKLSMDGVSANAINTYSLETLVTQNFPDWGGNFFSGASPGPSDTEYLPYDQGSGLLLYYQVNYQIVVHTTVIDNSLPPGTTYNYLTYGEARDRVQDIIEQLTQPIGNLYPITQSFQGTITTNTVSTFKDTIGQDAGGNWGRVPPYGEYTGPTTTVSGNGAGRSPPGYKGQVVNNSYTGSITWAGVSVNGESSLTYPSTGGPAVSGPFQQGAILVQPFPYAIDSMHGFYTIVNQEDDDDPTYQSVTPYATTSVSAEPTIEPWLMVTNDTHYIQGWMSGPKGGTLTPNLYLDGKNLMPALTRALNCQATDIAACYMDIALLTIKSLGNVQ